MSPAGSGSEWFRGAHEARTDLTWMLPWLLPLGLLVAVALISLSNVVGYLLVTAWGWVACPALAMYMRSRSRTPPGPGNRD